MADIILKDELRIPMIILPALSRYYRELAIDPGEGLAVIGDAFDITDIENQYINVEQFQALLRIFRIHTKDDAVGLSFGKSFSFEFLYDFELLLQTARGLDEVLPFAVSLINSINPISVFSCIRTEFGAVAYLRDKISGLLEDSESAMVTDAIFSLFQEICQRVISSEYQVRSLSVMHRISIGNMKRYKDCFDVNVSPGSPVNALRFDYLKGQHDVVDRSDELHDQVIEAVMLKLKNLQNANDFSAQVLAYIEGHEQPLELEINELASRLELSRRTFQRRLKDLGISYRTLIDTVMFSRAEQLLLDDELSIDSVATMLGYSSRRGLNRLIHRRSGASPNHYRQELLRKKTG